MGQFFNGWRRKVGVGTLLLACLFCCAWARSLNEVDAFQMSRTDRVFSGNGGIVWVAQTSGISTPFWAIVWYWDVMGRDRDSLGMCRQLSLPWDCRRRDGIAGIERGQHESQEIAMCWLRIDYKLLVLALTLLSAYLILWKPRKRTGAGHA